MLKLAEVIALSILVSVAYACLPEYSNQCATDADCCTGNCERDHPDWALGVCKKASSGEGRCLEDWNNACAKDENCCSKSCVRGAAHWTTGVCMPKSDGGSEGGDGGGDGGDGSDGGNDGDDGNEGGSSEEGDNGSNPGDGFGVTLDQFIAAVTSNKFPAPRQDQYEGFIKGLPKGNVASKREAAMALAQFMHESAGLTAKEEFACKDSKCPGWYNGAGCEAPGQYYYGRGYIQLSWCYNYRDASRGLGLGDLLLNQADLVASEQYAWDTAFWFWRERVRNGPHGTDVLNGLFGASTRAINGGLECNGQNLEQAQSRFHYYKNVYQAFSVPGQPDERGCY